MQIIHLSYLQFPFALNNALIFPDHLIRQYPLSWIPASDVIKEIVVCLNASTFVLPHFVLSLLPPHLDVLSY